MSDSQISCLSLNCWGLKFVAKQREERIQAITQELGNSNHDIIALQEIWVYSDYLKVQERVSKQLPHAKFFYSGALGAGLAIFSRWPIISTSVTPYSLNGVPIDVLGGDWFVGKAAASAVILHPLLGQVQVFNTHLYAKGGEDGPEYLRAHRLVNAWEFAKLVRQSAEMGRYVIALGDLNSIPTTLPMTIIMDHASLTDAWAATHPGYETGPAPTTALEAVERHGITADSPLNTWSAGKGWAHGWGKRLDYCLYRQPIRRTNALDTSSFPVLRASNCRVAFTELAPGLTCSYSDHFGLETTLQIETSLADMPNYLDIPKELSSASIATAINAWTECYRFAKDRGKREIAVFIVALVACVALAVGSPWLPYAWISPIFIVVATLLGFLAATMLYEGFLYGNWECNALMNAIEDMEHHRKGLELLKAPGHGLSSDSYN